MMRVNASAVRREQHTVHRALQNTTSEEKKEHVSLAARVLAIRELNQISKELQNEDKKDNRLEELWETEMMSAEHARRWADVENQKMAGYYLQFRAQLHGILDGIVVGD